MNSRTLHNQRVTPHDQIPTSEKFSWSFARAAYSANESTRRIKNTNLGRHSIENVDCSRAVRRNGGYFSKRIVIAFRTDDEVGFRACYRKFSD